jgi:hypothetical protein
MGKQWLGALVAAIVLTACLAIPAVADSQARVVRLSDVEGKVQVERNAAEGYQKAFLNMPMAQGYQVRTGDDGRAEIELEDGSAVRLTPNSLVSFPQLSLRNDGGKVSSVKLEQGTAYVDFRASKKDEMNLLFGPETAKLAGAAHLRVQLGDVDATLAVFKGNVTADGPSGEVAVSAKHSADFDLAKNDKYKLAKNIEPDPYDSWDKEQASYQDRYIASNNYSSYSPYAYGASDLNYYGNFFSLPGYGTVWQPYFAGAGWDPFMNGTWLFYPGSGYNWVSSYPWGWTPYHYGSWLFAPSYGWVWEPGGVFTGWNPGFNYFNAPARFSPPVPPRSGTAAVAVNRGGFIPPSGTASRKVVVRNGSAGLGIPRNSLRNLPELNQRVERNGSASVRVHTPALTPTYGPGFGSFPRAGAGGTRAGAPMRTPSGEPRMSAPPSPHGSASAPGRPH